jgi:large subunit ribosomal protein L3
MALGLLGKKIGMTQIFDENGVLIPVTLILAGPCPVVQKKDADTDGYQAVQLGFDEKPERLANRPEAGHVAKAGVKPCRILREFRGEETATYEVGQNVDIGIFADGERVDVIGTSKGRGFSSAARRHHSKGGPASHGSMYFNRPGSNGGSSFPARTFKGKKLPGQHGNFRTTAQNIQIVKRDAERNLLFVRGAVPGCNEGYVLVRKRAK